MKRKLTGKEFEELIEQGVKDFRGYDLSLLQCEDFSGKSLNGENYVSQSRNIDPQQVWPAQLVGTNLLENNLDFLSPHSLIGVKSWSMNLSSCNLKNFNPQQVKDKNLKKVILSENDLSYLGADAFDGVDIRGANLSNCNLKNFNPQKLYHKRLTSVNLSENDLSYLNEYSFWDVDINNANLSNCNLKSFNPQIVKDRSLFGANLSGNDLSCLRADDFAGVYVNKVNLSNCKLNGFNPQQVLGKNLYEVNLSGNDLSGLKPEAFFGAYIYNTNFENTGAHIDLTMVHRGSRIGNLKGCIVTNFEEAVWSNLKEENEFISYKIEYNEDSFDEEFISKHKEYFLDKTAPDELKKNFYSRTLGFDDFNKYYEFLKDKNYKLFFRKEYLKLFDFFELKDIRNVIRNNTKNIDLLLRLNKAEEIYYWYNIHKFVPHFTIAENFPKDQIYKFNCKRWSVLVKNEEFNKDYDTRIDLLKAAAVMGVFEKEEQGYTRLLQMINQEYKVSGAENEKRRVLNPDNVHRIFDSMSMTYDKDFRRLFLENFEKVLNDSEFVDKISSIQRNFADIKGEYKGKKVTLQMCEKYLESISYDNVKEGCHELAIYAKNNGYTQNDFEKLQLTFLEGKQRESSSIPEIEVKTNKLKGRILRLDDPLALVLGNLTECCQRIGGVGETAMLHSVLEKNGRVFVVEDEVGKVVAQSWVWRNGNVLCFDNIEVPDRALMHKREILEVYKEAANEFARKDKDAFEILIKEGKVSAKEAQQLKLAKITVGIGHTDVNLNSLEKDNERIMPEETKKSYNDKELYISDSEKQYILYKSLDYKKTEVTLKIDSLDLYKDGRDAAKEVKGEKIHKDVIRLLKNIESQAFPQEMQLLQDIQSYKDIANAYDYDKDKMRVVYNKDWYMVYEEKDKDVHIGDIAKVKASTPKEDVMAVKEREKEFYNLLNKYKKISMEARDKTSYILMKRLQKAGKVNILVEEALGNFRGNGEKMHKLVVTKNGTNDKNDAIVELGR